MKLLLITAIAMFLFGCSATPIDQEVVDCGKVKIGENAYIKKISLGNYNGADRVYFLVDENDRIISSSINTSITIQQGKTSSIESNMLHQ